MTTGRPFQESLFADDLLRESNEGLADWDDPTDAALDDLEAALRDLFDGFPTNRSPNESQTEDDLIWPLLTRLGWTASLRQQNPLARGREDADLADQARRSAPPGFTAASARLPPHDAW